LESSDDPVHTDARIGAWLRRWIDRHDASAEQAHDAPWPPPGGCTAEQAHDARLAAVAVHEAGHSAQYGKPAQYGQQRAEPVDASGYARGYSGLLPVGSTPLAAAAAAAAARP